MTLKLATILGDRANEGQFWTHSMMLVEGCSSISEGCLNCWSEAGQRVRCANPRSGFSAEVLTRGKWNGEVRLHLDRMNERILPRSNRRQPRIWTYWNDIFHHNVGDWFRDNLFEVISQSSDTHIICTKRPDEAVRYFSERPRQSVTLENVIFLVTMENQKRADERGLYVVQLANLGWKVGALVEPMLSPVSPAILEYGWSAQGDMLIDSLCWIICGPENGKGKRPFDGQWAMRLQAQAKAAGVPFFYKAGLLNGKRYIETP